MHTYQSIFIVYCGQKAPVVWYVLLRDDAGQEDTGCSVFVDKDRCLIGTASGLSKQCLALSYSTGRYSLFRSNVHGTFHMYHNIGSLCVHVRRVLNSRALPAVHELDASVTAVRRQALSHAVTAFTACGQQVLAAANTIVGQSTPAPCAVPVHSHAHVTRIPSSSCVHRYNFRREVTCTCMSKY